jgi:hypothetical protein
MEPPESPSIVEPSPPRPRLRIAHLLVWTACTALYLGVLRGTILPVTKEPNVADLANSVPVAVLMVLASVGSGASLAGLALWIACRRGGMSFPEFPGEYLIAMRGVSTGIQMAALAWSTTGSHPLPPIPSLMILYSVEFLGPYCAIMQGVTGPWLKHLVLRLFIWFLCMPLGPTICLVALLSSLWHDFRCGRRYPWTHWLGVGLDLWWNVLCLFLVPCLLTHQ